MRNLILSLVVYAFVTGPAIAGSLEISWVGGYHSTSGGEFTIEDYSGTPVLTNYYYATDTKSENGHPDSFQTFCLETKETVGIPGTYTYAVSNAAILGGTTTSDPISKGTAFLYAKFATGALAGYNYTAGPGRVASATMLQEAIHYLEGEILTIPSTNTFYNLAVSTFGAAVTADYTGSSVKALNLTSGSTKAQDQLYYVPLPGAVLLGFLGLGVAGIKLRKMA